MYGSMIPSCRLPGATDAAMSAPARRVIKTIGRRGLVSSAADVSSTSHSRRAAARSATMIANGLSSRCLRPRSAAAACSAAASTARWYPPSPFSASTWPCRISSAAPASGPPPTVPSAAAAPSAPASHSAGPQAGQQVGWAWNLRSAGSWYSAAHGAHMAKPAIVVSGRSYGTSRTIVNLGPQLVQLMNG